MQFDSVLRHFATHFHSLKAHLGVLLFRWWLAKNKLITKKIMEIIETVSLMDVQKEAIRKLWNQEYPWQLNYHSLADFDSYLDKLIDKKHFLLLANNGQLQGWACSFIREGEKWFTVLLDTTIQGQGKGTLLVNHLKNNEDTLSGWVVGHNHYIKHNGQTYHSPLRFYQKNGFIICSNNRLELDNLSAVKIVWKQT